MTEPDETRRRIVAAAGALFLGQGIKRTPVEEVARRAGVTRVTVHRHFGDKRALVEAVFLRMGTVFERVNADLEARPPASTADVLERIGAVLTEAPAGDLPARLDELRRLYPDVYAASQQVRLDGLRRVFDRLFALAEAEGRLRSGLNRDVVRGLFWHLLVHLFEIPELKAQRLSPAALFRLVSDVLLHGILGPAADERPGP